MRRPSTSSLFSSEASAPSGKDDGFQVIDKARRKVLHTQACDGTWHLLLSVAPSVLPYVLQSVDFWLSVLVYVCARLLLIFEFVEPTELGEFRGLATMGFLLALMLSFYVNISVNRLFQTNKDAMTLLREVNDVAMLLRGYVWKNDEQRDLTRRCVDYMCASMVHAYIGFARPYTAENLWVGYNEELGVVTPQENSLLMRHRETGGSRMRELLSWTVQGLAIAETKQWIAPPIAAEVNQCVTRFSDHCQALYDFRYLPIPFVLEHLLVFFIHIYLPIQTFEMAVQTAILSSASRHAGTLIVIETFGCLLALLANIGFQGLFAVGAFLEEPYGEGLVHARVSSFCRMSCKEARKLLDAGNPWTFTPPNEETQIKVESLMETLAQRGIEINKPKIGLRVLQYHVDRAQQSSPDFPLSPADMSQSLQSFREGDEDGEYIIAIEATGGSNSKTGITQMPVVTKAKTDLVLAIHHLTSVLTSALNADTYGNGHNAKRGASFGPRLGEKDDILDKLVQCPYGSEKSSQASLQLGRNGRSPSTQSGKAFLDSQQPLTSRGKTLVCDPQQSKGQDSSHHNLDKTTPDFSSDCQQP